MIKDVRIVMTGPGRGEVFIEGEKLTGVRSVRVETAVNKANLVTIGLLSQRVTFEGLADVSTIESKVQGVEKLEHREDAGPEDARLLTEAARLEIRPGDTLVVNVPGLLDNQEASRLKEQIEKCFPGQRVLVLAGGMSIGVLGPKSGYVVNHVFRTNVPADSKRTSQQMAHEVSGVFGHSGGIGRDATEVTAGHDISAGVRGRSGPGPNEWREMAADYAKLIVGPDTPSPVEAAIAKEFNGDKAAFEAAALAHLRDGCGISG